MFKTSSESFIKGAKLNIPNTTIYGFLLRRSAINASPIVARCHEEELSLSRLESESEIYAKAFRKLGVKEGEIVPLCLPPCNEAIVAFFALNRIGAVCTFVSAASSMDELKGYVRRFGSKLMVVSAAHAHELPSIIEECSLSRSVVITPEDSLGMVRDPGALTRAFLATSAPVPQHKRILSLTAFRSLGKNAVGNPDASEDKDRAAFIAYTSGTTGDPKAILLSNENIIAEVQSLKATLIQFGPRGNALQVVPFNYPYGFIVSTLFPMFVGRTASLTPMLTLSGVLDYLKMYRPYLTLAIPSFYSYMLNAPEFENADLSFLKYAISGGDKLDTVEKERINAFFRHHGSSCRINDGSGNGEGCGALTNTAALFRKYNYTSIGHVNYGVSVKFVDAEGRTVPMGKTGRFCFAGQNVMMEYYNAPRETAEVLYRDADGVTWFHTDTLGHMDADGWVYFDGRERRFFITFDASGSPYKVYCDHVQDVVKNSGLVEACAVVQTPDPVRCLLPKAYIRVAKGMDFNEAVNSIRAYCEKELQSYAAPVSYVAISDLPLTAAGKVDYRALERDAVSA